MKYLTEEEVEMLQKYRDQKWLKRELSKPSAYYNRPWCKGCDNGRFGKKARPQGGDYCTKCLKLIQGVDYASELDLGPEPVKVKKPHPGAKTARNAVIIDLYTAGATLKDIADRFGISSTRVRDILKKNNVIIHV